MKIKFKPTNLGRTKPKSRAQEPEELLPPDTPQVAGKASEVTCSEGNR